METVYPEHTWDNRAFTKANKGFWADMINQRQFFESIAQELRIEKADDWYRVTLNDIHERGGGGMLAAFYGNSLLRGTTKVLLFDLPY